MAGRGFSSSIGIIVLEGLQRAIQPICHVYPHHTLGSICLPYGITENRVGKTSEGDDRWTLGPSPVISSRRGSKVKRKCDQIMVRTVWLGMADPTLG